MFLRNSELGLLWERFHLNLTFAGASGQLLSLRLGPFDSRWRGNPAYEPETRTARLYGRLVHARQLVYDGRKKC